MKPIVFALATFALLDAGPHCGPRRRPVPPPPPTAGPAPSTVVPEPTGPMGAVSGAVTFVGTPPTMPEQKRGVDPACARTPMKEEEIVVAPNGALKNVLVRVIGAPPTPPPAEKATIEQRDCRYLPRILPVVRNQKIAIKNGDPTLHNVHGYLGTATEFNVAQVPEAPNLDKSYAEVGMHKLRCDIHQWMTGYIWVHENRYFAVTGDDGSFAIPQLPVGSYQLEAWHERFGTKRVPITVAVGQPAAVQIAYTSKDDTTPR
jgi:hypothetical protein